MRPKTLSVSLVAAIQERLHTRRGEDHPLSAQIAEDLESYWAVLGYGLSLACKRLTRSEAMLILDVLMGTQVDPTILPMMISGGLAHSVCDGISLDGLDGKWAVDGDGMKAKIRGLGPVETLALIDWARTFWRTQSASGQEIEAAVSRFLPGEESLC